MATQPPKPQIRTRHSSRTVNGDGPPVSVLVNDNKPPARERLEIAVLGSARLTENDDRWTQAHQLGALLADEGYVVVTGGYGGLMAAVSRGAHERGGPLVGVPLPPLAAQRPKHYNTP